MQHIAYRQLLSLLNQEPMHGYDLWKLLQWRHASTVYYRLAQLERHGHAVSVVVSTPNAPERRVYALTQSGKKFLWYLQRAKSTNTSPLLKLLLQ